MPNLNLGLEGSEALLPSTLERPMALLLEGPSGGERDLIFLQYVARGLKDGEGALVILASKSPRRFLRELERLGVDLGVVEAEDRLRIIDWYSHREESFEEIQREGPLIRVPSDFASLSRALAQMVADSRNLTGGRAAVEFITPAMLANDSSKVIPLVAEVRAVTKALGMLCLFVVEKDAHDPHTLEALRLNADGVLEIERVTEGQAVQRHLKAASIQGVPGGPSLLLEVTRDGLLRISHGPPSQALPGPPHPPAVEPRTSNLPPAAMVVPAVPVRSGQPPVTPPPPPQAKRETEKALQQQFEEELKQKIPCGACGTPLDPEAEICYVCGTPVPKEDASRIKTLNLLRNCERQLKADPKNVDAWFVKAAALAKLKDFKTAVDALNELTKLNPLYPGLWIFKGKLYSRLGDENMARLCRRRALELEGTPPAPSSPPGPPALPPQGAAGQRFRCTNCGRWLPADAASCPCGAVFS